MPQYATFGTTSAVPPMKVYPRPCRPTLRASAPDAPREQPGGAEGMAASRPRDRDSSVRFAAPSSPSRHVVV